MRRKRHVRIIRRNWDADFYHDLLGGDAFIISEPAKLNIDGSEQKSLYGADSPLYGTTYEDENAFIERYRCQCGEFKSRQFEGQICPLCGTKVEYKDSNINVTGWITLGENRIISPYYYQKLNEAFGGKVIFPDIIYAKYKIDTDGNRIKAKPEDMDEEPSSEWAGIGVDEFYTRYEEILETLKLKRKNKAKCIDFLLKEKRKVFVSHIPIISTMLRPQSITSDTFYYTKIDQIINPMYSLAESLKTCNDSERDYILERLQKRVNETWDIYFEELHGKEGHIRHNILGGSLNYTSRNVICPDPTLKDNEIDLSYNTFLEVFKYKIIYYIMKLEDITLAKAYNIWKKAAKFDKRVYDIMLFMIEKLDLRVLINRNPTLKKITKFGVVKLL